MKNLFLQRIVIHSYLYRNKGGWNSWVSMPCNPREVVVIGKRTLQQGSVEWEEDIGHVFTRDPKKDIQALLVVEGMHQKPYYIAISEYQQEIERIMQPVKQAQLL